MKKSTLLTTIAMIVVVVVALSTATYAWFSSSTASTATANVTTASDSALMMYNGTIGAGGAITFASAGDAITLNAALLSGLHAPKTAIGTKVDKGTPTGASIGTTATDFFEGEHKTTGDVVKTATVADVAPNVIRVAVGKKQDSAKTLTLKIYVDLGSDAPADATKYAATEVTYFVAATDKANATVTYTNGYKHANGATITATEAVPAATTVDATTGMEKKVYSNATVETFATSTGTDTDMIGGSPIVASGRLYLVYTIALGSVQNSGDGFNLAIYTWLNGYVVDDAAIGSALTVTYSFTLV